jgi:transposase
MIDSKFLSASDRRELLSCVKRQREDHGVARRANALLLLDDGMSCAQIGRVLFLDDDTVRGWSKQYLAEGWDAVAYDGWKGGQLRMSVAQEAALCGWLEGRFCRSTVEIRAHIATEFNLSYSHSGCVKFLARPGFEYRKPKAVPRAADASRQAKFIAFYENLLNSLGADEAVYFVDAVHPEYQSKPAFGWVKKGVNAALKTTSGRGRVNIHGALNLESFDAPFVAPITVDGQSAVQLLAKIEARNPGKRTIHVIWDNAPYHKGPDVRAFLSRKNCRIHLIQLPPYCPHLNPIERLWAVMHQHVTHNRYYPTQKQFTDNFRIISDQNLRVLE